MMCKPQGKKKEKSFAFTLTQIKFNDLTMWECFISSISCHHIFHANIFCFVLLRFGLYVNMFVILVHFWYMASYAILLVH